MTTVCLTMIVRNEAHVITRAIESARPLITHWAVCDTGSTDGTQDVVRASLRDVPGQLIERPWVDFATNRNESLALARERAEYALLLDADDKLEFPPNAAMPELTEQAYAVRAVDGPIAFVQPLLLDLSQPWRFEGVVHEQPLCNGKEPERVGFLEGVVYHHLHGGSRHFDPSWQRRDADLLEAEARQNPSSTRSVYHLARCYEGCGEYARAIANYERRALMGGSAEEIYDSLFSSARVRARMGRPPTEIESVLAKAAALRPTRAEALYEIALLRHMRGDLPGAFESARAAAALPMPPDRLFVAMDVYRWGALYELAICARALGDLATAKEAARKLLSEEWLPADKRPFAEETLALP